MRQHRLEIKAGPLSVPLCEISGICQSHGTLGQELRLLAIGDDSPIVITVDIEPGTEGHPLCHDLTTVLSASTTQIGNWEAFATDSDGTVFILQEDPGAVAILDADLGELLHTVHLQVDPGLVIGNEWTSAPKSRGEGLVLLGQGHLLVVKEREPKRLLEFGPEGATPQGISPSTVLDVHERFSMPPATQTEFELLKQWKFEHEAKHEMEDLSDAAVAPNGRIYLLSDRSQRIGKIQERVAPDERHVSLDKSWEMPAQIDKPEGLTIGHDWSPIVAVDKEEQENSHYVLTNLRA
ncbi:SdiA-regulated domain-containing protein [Actinopolymorpha sp. B17G11]|uniref:SdiA-regulated domain-containing protein n=1 Tax=Actinopolymorpha sp. B17G11 TaxID=3160861 RepID=UPI0032E467F3